MKNEYDILKIAKEDIYYWLLNKHYAKVVPAILYHNYGLFKDGKLNGVCCYGSPACHANSHMGRFNQIELLRLVINENLEKNILSYFVGRTLRYLPKELSLISYADDNMGHHGYIYQATNWIYTGMGNATLIWTDNKGKRIHGRYINGIHQKTKSELTINEMAQSMNYTKSIGSSKHRYFQFIGNKKQRREWINELKNRYQILPYPKGENKRYDMIKETIHSTNLMNF